MAEYLLKDMIKKQHLEDKIDVKSAGIFVNENSVSPSPLAVDVLSVEYKIDMSAHRPQKINLDLIMESDLILCMEESMSMYLKANLHNIDEDSIALVMTLKEYVGLEGNVSDPYGGNKQTYEDTAQELSRLMDLLVVKIINSNNKI